MWGGLFPGALSSQGIFPTTPSKYFSWNTTSSGKPSLGEESQSTQEKNTPFRFYKEKPPPGRILPPTPPPQPNCKTSQWWKHESQLRTFLPSKTAKQTQTPLSNSNSSYSHPSPSISPSPDSFGPVLGEHPLALKKTLEPSVLLARSRSLIPFSSIMALPKLTKVFRIPTEATDCLLVLEGRLLALEAWEALEDRWLPKQWQWSVGDNQKTMCFFQDTGRLEWLKLSVG